MLCCTGLFAQQQTPQSFSEADNHLSEIFSREFMLPDNLSMQTFNYDVGYTIFGNGNLFITSHDTPTEITIADEQEHSDLFIYKQRTILHDSIVSWVNSKVSLLPRSDLDLAEEDSIQLHAKVCYSPLYYAQTGDTLFCTGERINGANAEGEEAVTFYRFCMRNHRNTPYYAIANKRDKDHLTLRYCDIQTHKAFAVENYQTDSPDKILKTGNQFILADDGKTVRIHQTWENNFLKEALVVDKSGKKLARYKFYYAEDESLPRIKAMVTFYPSGTVKLRTKYEEDIKTITAFSKNGKEANFKTASKVEKALTNYFKDNFHPLIISNYAVGIDQFTLTLDCYCDIEESGDMRINTITPPQLSWEYESDDEYQSEASFRFITRRFYKPYFDEFWHELSEQTFPCDAASINGKGVASKLPVHIVCKFQPTLSKPGQIESPDSLSTDSNNVAIQEDVVYMMAEHMPFYPGGKPMLFKFLEENLHYPAYALEHRLQGRVICQFIVETDGSLSNLEVIRSAGDASLDNEAIRVIQSMPGWVPGEQQGANVRVRYTMPVSFRLPGFESQQEQY